MLPTRCILILLILIICSCQEQSTSAGQKKITRLSFAIGGCFGDCPFLAIEIDNNLDYKFYGGKHSEIQGYYIGKIPQTLWDTINIRFESLQNKNLDTNFRSVDDLSIQSIIHFGQNVKNISAQEMELPKDIRENFYWLMDSYKRIKLKKMVDSIRFETTIQNGLPVIPPPPTPN